MYYCYLLCPGSAPREFQNINAPVSRRHPTGLRVPFTTVRRLSIWSTAFLLQFIVINNKLSRYSRAQGLLHS